MTSSSPGSGETPEKGHEQDYDRDKVFAQGTPPIPRKAFVIAVAAFVVLGLGGVVLDHFFGGPVASSISTAATDPPTIPTTTLPPETPGRGSELSSSISAFLGLTKLAPEPAPEFTLQTGGDSSVSLRSFVGKVVVISFFDSRCNDICPVLSSEIHQASEDLGPLRSQVVFLTVNTDPLATAISSDAPARNASNLNSLSNWHFLTGSVSQLDAVWKKYGVAIEAQASSGIVSHNNVLYFIGPDGESFLKATPFADESTSGTFSLPPVIEQRFASGIASEIRSVLADPSAAGQAEMKGST